MSLLHRILRAEDWQIASEFVNLSREPDVVIAPSGGVDYLYRWHLIPRNPHANVYFHVQIASDPERPLHDHPWDNQSVILAGGYQEIMQDAKGMIPHLEQRRTGQTVWRKAEVAHRLVLPPTEPYTMTLFTTGAVRRDWGFWIGGVWYSHKDCLSHDKQGKSTFHYPEGV